MNKKQLIDKIQSEINGLLTAMLFIYELEEH